MNRMNYEQAESWRRVKNLADFHLYTGDDDALRSASKEKSASLGLSQHDLERYSISRLIRSQVESPGMPPTTGGLEVESARVLAKRFDVPLDCVAIPTDVLTYRGGLNFAIGTSAPEGLSFVDTFRQRSLVFQMGAQHLPGLKDDVAIPRQVTDQTLQWPGATGSVSASDASLGQLSAVPRRACVITDVSEQLLRQSSADRIITAGLASVMAVGVDDKTINGTGGAEPLGILNTTGIGTLSGTTLALAGVVGVQKTVASLNGILNSAAAGYLGNPIEAEKLMQRQRFTGSDSPLWQGSLHDGSLAGVQAKATKQMPAATMLYGDWSTVYVCEWGPLLLSADRGGTRFNQGLVGIRAQWFVDVIVSSPSSFVKITGIT